jgi:putative ABC transport system substrate-binding protein
MVLQRRAVVGSALALAAATMAPAAAAGTSRKYVVAVLSVDPRDDEYLEWKVFVAELARLGYVEGENVAFVHRYSGEDTGRMTGLAVELAAMKPDVIFAFGGTVSTRAAMKATSTIPIVFFASADPVALGLVASLARPGGNVTGTSSLARETGQKTLEILVEALGRRPGDLVYMVPTWVGQVAFSPEVRGVLSATARSLGKHLEFLNADSVEALEEVLRHLSEQRIGGVVFEDYQVWSHDRPRIALMFKQRGLPTITDQPEFVRAGMLLSYTQSRADFSRKAASNVDRILRGARPADVPVEQVSKWDMMVNLTTAKALGLELPSSVLARADQILE